MQLSSTDLGPTVSHLNQSRIQYRAELGSLRVTMPRRRLELPTNIMGSGEIMMTLNHARK